MINLLWSGLLIGLLCGCGWNGTPTRNNDFTPLTSIEISADYSTIAAHTSTKLRAVGHFSGLYTRDITDQTVWLSGSATVADFITAASKNRVTGSAPGTAILTATVGNISATYTLTVSSATVAKLTITPATPTVNKGLSKQFAVSGDFSDATVQDLTFDTTWTSSTPNVATISNAAGSNGLVQTLAVGSTTITATFFDGSSTGTLLTVTEPALQSITISPANPSILTLSTGNFTARGAYSDGSTPDITPLVAWSTSNTAYATISSSGTATTLTQGTTTIKATLGSVSSTTNLRVTGGNLTVITLSPAINTLVKDTVGPIKATGTFSNGSIRDISGAVTWSPASTGIVTVTTPGGNGAWLNPVAVTPASTPTTVTAMSGTVTAAIPVTLTVTAPQLESIALSPISLDLNAGTSSHVSVIATFSGNLTQDVTTISAWKSNDETKATVGTDGHAAGRVTGVSAGAATTTINATFTYSGKTISVPVAVTVTPRILQSVTISGPSSIAAGNQVTFTALANYIDNTSTYVTEDAIWTIDNPNVAILADSLNQPGQVVGVDSDTATLTVTFGGKTQTVTITVP